MLHIYLLLAKIEISPEQIGIPRVEGDGDTFNAIVGMVYSFIAALALFFIVRAALLFVQANGDAGQINEARNTILYSIIALVLSTLVFTLINFAARSVAG